MKKRETVDYAKFVASFVLCCGIALGYMYILFEVANDTQRAVMTACVYYLWAESVRGQDK